MKWMLRAREAEADEERDEDQRRAAEEVGVDDRQGAERSRSAPWQAAYDGDGEGEDEHERLRHHHQLEVHLEARPDVRERIPKIVGREEDPENFMHASVAGRYDCLRTGTFEKSTLNHFFWSLPMVPFFQSFAISVSTTDVSLEPFCNTAPYCSCVMIWPAIAP